MQNATSQMREWMFDRALPWWSEHGIDKQHGGYVERFRLDGTNDHAPFKRARVTGRQIYVFSHASLLGWRPGLELAQLGARELITKYWLGQDRGFARRVSQSGEVLDATPDLYDLAFILFAFGWFFRASNDREMLRWAHRTMDVIETKLTHPGGLGFRHEMNAVEPRQQNPHMHLIEACLVLCDAGGDQRFADVAQNVAALFRSKFFDPHSETLAEYFTDDWRRLPGEAGAMIEPGHQFEWAWILTHAKRILNLDLSEEIRALIRFAERFGVDQSTGATRNVLSDTGKILDGGSRTWPNTERIKAAVALFELDGIDPSQVITSSANYLFGHHLNHRPRGTWVDLYGADGEPKSDTIPSSTLYHVFLAFAEALRIEEAVANA